VEDDEMTTRVIEADERDEDERWIEDESSGEVPGDRGGDHAWAEEDDEPIAPRPRGRLLRPLPLALIAVVIAAGGFLGGVEAQKGSEGSRGSGSLPGGGSLPSFTSGAPTASGSEGATTPFAATSSAAASGTVTAVDGHTIYVKESDGTVVAVKAGDGSTVTRDSNVAAKKVHPGDTVVVQGSKHGSTVKASSIAATESGLESTSGFGRPAADRAGAGGDEGGSEEPSVESLFEE
jgi:hypothetical protein